MAQLPTVQQLYKVKLLKKTFQEAWNGSFPNSKTCREVGGYIYVGQDGFIWNTLE
ncbi:hypothetical protein SERLADRAFT_399177 [Serpula lacrymans var. lacrymans S7.9]|uniref:Uncharacterized protein n=1 Tax=Serpula lacrymans var. lacrymans (strain S7.9) TaxID=578457 RepID=F8P7I9_SERL9|nr:uncharacterized protein SERLADRAFT_399177 [Serpula lacrymans var. lacrymans S7.9]EGO21400.1 hypothetical protein SERLADRAFT_399177 [Serpula lacrymans var. lacrymans S7.9]